MATAGHYNEGPDSDKYIDEKCSPCTYNNKDQTADHYCYDCEKHLCKSCLGFHNALHQDHVVKQGNRGDESELTEKCENHKELITLFCLQHKELMCIQCLRQDHRSCKDVQHIQETARQLTAQLQSALSNVQESVEALDNYAASIQNTGSVFLKEFEEKLLSLEQEMREKAKGAIKSKEDQLAADRNDCGLAKDEVNRYLDDIKKTNPFKANLLILKKKAQTITETVDALHNKSDSWIKGHQLNITANMKIMYPVNSANSFVIDVSTKVVDMNSFGTVGGVVDSPLQAAEGRIGNIRESREKRGENPEEIPREKRGENPEERPREKRGENPKERPREKRGENPEERPREKRGGNPEERPREKRGENPEERPREKRGENPEERPRKKRKKIPEEVPINKPKGVDETVKRPGEKPLVGKAASFNVRIPEDKNECAIYGCCSLSDGCLVIADKQNSRLKRVDPSSGTVTMSCDTSDGPWGVCCIGPQEVAVAFLGSTQVHVYNTESLTRTRTVELGHRTSSTERIACHGGLLYCAWYNGNILYVHDVGSGRKLREISKDTDGRKLFSLIRHIAVNSSGDRVYVTDGKRGLVCVGVDGRQIFHLSQQDLGLSRATGVTTDHHGHVYVCGWGSQNVVKVTGDGHMVGQILSKEDGITWCPRCLSYDVNRSRLYVGGESDQLLMVEYK